MDLVLNNIKGLAIHLLMSVVSILLVLLLIMASPIYSSQITAIVMIVVLCLTYLLIYLKLTRCLNLETNKMNDYLVGLLAFLIGIAIWGLSIHYSKGSIHYIPEELEVYWMPYNAYIFPSWFMLYGQENPLFRLLGSLSPAVLLTAGMKIKRYRGKLNQ